MRSAKNMTPAEFAAFERSQGAQVRAVDDIFWRKVRPFFYRPLLPFQEYLPSEIRTPAAAWVGCCQFAVPDGHPASSNLSMLIFDEGSNYSLGYLDHNRRRQVNLAAKRLTIREIEDPAELRTKAYPVYMAFYERTQYAFRADRRDKDVFARWIDEVFQYSGNVVLGCYSGAELCAVSVSQIVGDTWVYSTFFCDDRGLKSCAADLTMHTVREKAAALPGMRQVFAGMYKGGKGLDNFYLLRGCKIVRKPAVLRVNPATSAFMRLCMPGMWAKVLGKVEDEGKNGAAECEALAR